MSNPQRLITTLCFKGRRFEDNSLDFDVLPELMAYKKLVIETAKKVWRQKNPQRKQLPKKFESSLRFKFFEIQPGSTNIPVVCEMETEGQMPLFSSLDEIEEGARLIDDALLAVANDCPLPESFPKAILPHFEDYGKMLRQDERIEQQQPNGTSRSLYTPAIRERLIHYAEPEYEDVVDIIGTVTEVDVRRASMEISIDKRKRVKASFNPEDEKKVTTALKEHTTVKIRVKGRAQYSSQGQIKNIIQVDSLISLPGGEIPFSQDTKPIWEVAEEIIGGVPEDFWGDLPVDLASNLDHYLYGTPKNKR